MITSSTRWPSDHEAVRFAGITHQWLAQAQSRLAFAAPLQNSIQCIALGVALAVSLFITAHSYAATCCDTYTCSTAIPSSYGAAYNFYSAAMERLLKTTCCTDAMASVTVGNGDTATYVYKQGYTWGGTTWQPYGLTGNGALLSEIWHPKGTSSTDTVPSGYQSRYYVGYTCQQINGTWKCGCADTACTTSYWQLQAFRAASPMATTPSSSTTLSVSQLKYAIETITGDAVFCGPPVVPGDYNQQLLAQFPSVAANAEEYAAIVEYLNFTSTQTLTDAQKLQVVNEHNKLSVISLTKTGTGYRFSLRAGKPLNRYALYEGTISAVGSVQVTKKTTYIGGCPICVALHTKIDTPKGPVAVENITRGMKVWTVTKDGVRVSAELEKVTRTQVPSDHHVVHLMLTDGRELFVSPGHPTGDGRTIGALKAGNLVNGTRVKGATLVPYTSSYTYDLLPAGDTGEYWANGILIGSTLK